MARLDPEERVFARAQAPMSFEWSDLITFIRLSTNRVFRPISYIGNLSETEFAARPNGNTVMGAVEGHLLELGVRVGSKFDGILKRYGLNQSDTILLFGEKNDVSPRAISRRLEQFELDRRVGSTVRSEPTVPVEDLRFIFTGSEARSTMPFLYE